MSITRYEFQEVGVTWEKSGKCTKCGKRRRVKRKFWQTMNPFNRDDQGRQKTRFEIIRENRNAAEHWMVEPFVCSSCGG